MDETKGLESEIPKDDEELVVSEHLKCSICLLGNLNLTVFNLISFYESAYHTLSAYLLSGVYRTSNRQFTIWIEMPALPIQNNSKSTFTKSYGR